MVVVKLAAFDLSKQPDRADRMFVHRIMVVHVILHLGHDTPEIGYEAAEYARLVHPAQHRFRVARARQHIEEQGVRLRIAPDAGVAQPDVPARLRSEEHTSELQSLMRSSYAGFCLTHTKLDS